MRTHKWRWSAAGNCWHVCFYDEVYLQRFYILFGEADVNKWCVKHLGHSCDEYLSKTYASCLTIESKNNSVIVFRFSAMPEIGTIAHECLHAVDFTFNRRGIEWDNAGFNNEAFNYYLGHLVNKVHSLLEPFKPDE